MFKRKHTMADAGETMKHYRHVCTLRTTHTHIIQLIHVNVSYSKKSLTPRRHVSVSHCGESKAFWGRYIHQDQNALNKDSDLEYIPSKCLVPLGK